MKYCQLLLLVGVVLKFFVLAYMDVNGQKAKPPEGFEGIVITVLVCIGSLALLWGAGAMSELLR